VTRQASHFAIAVASGGPDRTLNRVTGAEPTPGSMLTTHRRRAGGELPARLQASRACASCLPSHLLAGGTGLMPEPPVRDHRLSFTAGELARGQLGRVSEVERGSA
jgi:hypothetical protein